MSSWHNFDWLIENIRETAQDKIIQDEWIKNSVLDYLWPIFDFEYITPYNIAPKGKVIIEYNTIFFSKNQEIAFQKYGITINKNIIEIDCNSQYLTTGVDRLMSGIKQVKDILL